MTPVSTNYTWRSTAGTHWDHIDGVVLGLSVMVMGGPVGGHVVWGQDQIQSVSHIITLTCTTGELARVISNSNMHNFCFRSRQKRQFGR